MTEPRSPFPDGPGSPDQLRLILHTVTDGILVVDTDGVVLFANASAEKVFGRAGMVGSVLGLPLAPDGGYADIQLIRDTGLGWAELRAVGIDWAGRPAHLISVRDVTDRHDYEHQLGLAAKVFENSHEGILVTDADANILLVNRAFEDTTGYSATEVIGRNPRILKSDLHEPGFYATLWQAVAEEGVWQGEIWNRRKNGTVYPELLSISRVGSGSNATTNYIGIFSDLSESKRIETHLEHLSSYDALTGLPNRETFRNGVDQSLVFAAEHDGRCALVLINVDGMRAINDRFGIGVGDQVLRELGLRLKNAIGTTGLVARLGADEFGALMVNVDRQSDPILVAQPLIDQLHAPIEFSNTSLLVETTTGMSLFPDDGATQEALFAAADTALEQGKQLGRGMVYLAHREQNERAQRSLTIRSGLQFALQRDELLLHYQPQVDARTCTIVGAEALLRWTSKDLGAVSPAEFIPVAEKTGLIVPIGRWVMAEAARTLAGWIRGGLAPIRVAVNVSAYQLINDDVPALVEQVLSDSGLERQYLEIEITESAMLDRDPKALTAVHKLHAAGVKLALDDFGTGYSSMSYLNRVRLDLLKIDQSFVRDITSEPRSAAIARATIAMSKSLGMNCIAEGVETEAQMHFLRGSGCELLQGFLFSRGVAADVLETILKAGGRFENFAESMATTERVLLCVDDEPFILASLRRQLRGEGYRILTAQSGAQALELLAVNKVQVIVTDQRMPGMSGTELLSRAKELYPDTIRIMLSGYTDLESITSAVNSGAIFRFLTKPWEDEQLKRNLRQAFDVFAGLAKI